MATTQVRSNLTGLLTVYAHAISRHGMDASVIIDAYNRGAPCDIYESCQRNRRMVVLRLWGTNVGLVFTTKYRAFITAFYCSERRLERLIKRDEYMQVDG